MPPEKCVWLHDQEGLLPGTNELCQQNEEDTIGPGDWWSFHPPFEENKLLAQEGIFRDQFGLASAKICHGLQRQGEPERFRPTSPRERRAHVSSHPLAAGERSQHEPYQKLLHYVRVSSFEHEDAIDDV